MSDELYFTEATKRAMSRLSVLVDEVLLVLDETLDGFTVERVMQELRFIYEEKRQPLYGQLSNQAWQTLIRSRLLALGFGLRRNTLGTMEWVLPLTVGEMYGTQ